MPQQYCLLPNTTPCLARAQKGLVLIMALIMLLIMTSLGVTTMSGSILQERIASNYRQQYIARTNAEAALLSAENFLNDLAGIDGSLTLAEITAGFLSAGGGDFRQGLYSTKPIGGGVATPFFMNMHVSSSWTVGIGGNSIDTTDTPNISNDPAAVRGTYNITLLNPAVVANPPRIAIEYLGCEAEATVCSTGTDATKLYYSFRIVAIGWGVDPNAYSVLQALYLSKQL